MERYSYNICNNLMSLRFHCFSCTDTQVQQLRFSWHLPASVYFMEGSLTHQNQQESLTTPWDFHQFRIGALGTKLQSHCKRIFRLSLQLHRSSPLSLKCCSVQDEELQGFSSTLTAGNAPKPTDRPSTACRRNRSVFWVAEKWAQSSLGTWGVSCAEFSGENHWKTPVFVLRNKREHLTQLEAIFQGAVEASMLFANPA